MKRAQCQELERALDALHAQYGKTPPGETRAQRLVRFRIIADELAAIMRRFREDSSLSTH